MAERGRFVRGGPPRVLRSPLTGVWYVATSYRELDDGGILASRKREVHPVDAAALEGMREDAKRWRAAEAAGHLVDLSEMGYGLQHPPSCRPKLMDCPFNRWLAEMQGPGTDRAAATLEFGRYRMTVNTDRWPVDATQDPGFFELALGSWHVDGVNAFTYALVEQAEG